jgi:hypothetical protein
MLVAAHFIVVLLIVIILITRGRKGPRLPIQLKSFDEIDCVCGAAAWATGRLGNEEANRKLPHTNGIRMSSWFGTPLPYLVRLPQAELAILAPFIDAIIEGRGPPLNLPSEYEDYRPRVLAAFKARMKAEGLWPGSSPDYPLSVAPPGAPKGLSTPE